MKRVLIVENDKVFQRIIRRILEPAGFLVLTAGSVEDAAALTRHERIDLALVDWNLPGQNGPNFCRRLREDARFKDLPVIMLSVRSLPEEQIHAVKDAGADHYMTKPFTPEDLLARVQSFVDLIDR